jgi:hypothetical protein
MTGTRTFALNKLAILEARLSLFLIKYEDINICGEVHVQFHAILTSILGGSE